MFWLPCSFVLQGFFFWKSLSNLHNISTITRSTKISFREKFFLRAHPIIWRQQLLVLSACYQFYLRGHSHQKKLDLLFELPTILTTFMPVGDNNCHECFICAVKADKFQKSLAMYIYRSIICRPLWWYFQWYIGGSSLFLLAIGTLKELNIPSQKEISNINMKLNKLIKKEVNNECI